MSRVIKYKAWDKVNKVLFNVFGLQEENYANKRN
jgi:uncharacterized protein YdaU (DUF1376 family)